MTQTTALTVPVRSAVRLLGAANACGIAVGAQGECVGVLDRERYDPEARLAAERYWQLWETVLLDPRAAGIGLRTGKALQRDDFGVVGHVLMHSATMRSALVQLERYGPLLGDHVPRIEESGDCVLVRVSLRPRVARLHEVSDMMAMDLARAIGMMVERRPPLRMVQLQRPCPADPSAYTASFGSCVEFNSAETVLVFDRSLLTMRLPRRDDALRGYLSREADALLTKLPRYGTLVDQVRCALASQLARGEPTLASVSRALNCSTRTLQRGLGRNGTSLSVLLEETRMELALSYLQAQDVSIGEIAYRLGYSEPSAFHRAFRRWTGQTPLGVRTETSEPAHAA